MNRLLSASRPFSSILILVSLLTLAFVCIHHFSPDNTSYNQTLAIAGSSTAGGGGPFATVGSIGGYVRDSATGTALKGVSVSARMEDDFRVEALDAATHQVKAQGRIYLTQNQKYIAETMADGSYEIVRLLPGTYKIWADHTNEGYIKTYYDNGAVQSSGIPVEVNEETITTGIDFSLIKGGTVSGTVRQKTTGQPVSEITIEAKQLQSSTPAAETTTGPDGTYSLAGLRAGEYTIKADGANEYVTMYFDNQIDSAEATQLTVETDTIITNVDFSLSSFGAITGKITAAGNPATPLAGVLVNGYPLPEGPGKTAPISQGVTDANGSYVIDQLPPGTYKVEAKPPATYTAKVFGQNTPAMPPAPITVADGQTTADIDLVLQPGSTISGLAVDQGTGMPLVYAQVILYDATSNDEFTRGVTDASGRYSITQLLPGTYKLFAHFANYGDEYYNNKISFEHAQQVQVNAGEARSDIDFQLSTISALPQGSISGTISQNINNEPLARICVTAFQATSDQIFGYKCSDENGRYLITGLAPGQYRICAKPKTDYTEGCLGINGQTVKPENATPVTLDGENQLTDMNLKLRKFGKVSGSLFRSKDGQSIGTYTIPNLEPGFYHIRVNPQTTGYQEEYFDNIVNVTAAALVEVREDQETANVDFNLEVGP